MIIFNHMITGKNYIAGELSAKGSRTFKTFDPLLNQENDWFFTEATSDEMDKAIKAATLAFDEYRLCDDKVRAGFLRKIATNIELLGDDLLTIYHKESGLDLARAKVERTRTLYQLRMFADLISSENWRKTIIEMAEPFRTPKPKPDLRKTYIPLGPIAVFGASNFPFAYSTAGGDTASALAVGCPVIVKSHPMHAGTGEMVSSAIVKAVEECNLPKGVFSNLNSQGIQVGVDLVTHPLIKGVGFTGSINGGRALMDLSAKRPEPIPVFAEMGSINPVIISEKSLENNRSKWVKEYAESITNGTGQFCTNPGLIIGVESEQLKAFSKELAKALESINPKVMLNPSIKSSFDRLKSDMFDSGAQKLTSEIETKENFAAQAIATVSGQVFLTNPKLHHEVFGPYSLIVQCDSLDQVEEILSKLEGQLTGTVIVEESEYKDYKTVVQILSKRVGRIIFNGVPTGVEVTAAMNHGGPYPASSDSRFTAVGIDSIWRWLRPVTYQNFPSELLPKELIR